MRGNSSVLLPDTESQAVLEVGVAHVGRPSAVQKTGFDPSLSHWDLNLLEETQRCDSLNYFIAIHNLEVIVFDNAMGFSILLPHIDLSE